MKITPIEIRQHSFEKGFRGYITEEVDAFLGSLSNEWERVMNESKMMKMQLEIAERDLNKLKEVEMQLFRSLKTADEDREQIVGHANQAAQATLNEAQTKAEELLKEAHQKAAEIETDARRKASITRLDAENQAKFLREDLLNELKSQDRDLKGMERYRDNLLVQLRSLANNTTDSLERFEKKFLKGTVAEKISEVKTQISESEAAVKAAALAVEEASQGITPPTIEADEATDHVLEDNAETPISEPESEPKPEAAPDDALATVAESPEEAQASEIETSELEMPEIQPDSQAETPQKSEDKPKKGGSFFDQID